jgi:uncharacterized membrane protein
MMINRYVKNRYISFCLVALLSSGIAGAIFKACRSMPSFSPLYSRHSPFFSVFHLFIACFMAMKYWCDRKRLYLVAIAFAFTGSALLMAERFPASRHGLTSISSTS